MFAAQQFFLTESLIRLSKAKVVKKSNFQQAGSYTGKCKILSSEMDPVEIRLIR
jgi:hypothetical protein